MACRGTTLFYFYIYNTESKKKIGKKRLCHDVNCRFRPSVEVWPGKFWLKEQPMKSHHHYHNRNHQWLYSLCKDPGRLTLEVSYSIKTLGRTPLDEWSARRKGLYLHRTTQNTKTSTDMHALSGLITQDLSIQAIRAFASDRVATGTGIKVKHCH
jgi:hypothetical protein